MDTERPVFYGASGNIARLFKPARDQYAPWTIQLCHPHGWKATVMLRSLAGSAASSLASASTRSLQVSARQTSFRFRACFSGVPASRYVGSVTSMAGTGESCCPFLPDLNWSRFFCSSKLHRITSYRDNKWSCSGKGPYGELDGLRSDGDSRAGRRGRL